MTALGCGACRGSFTRPMYVLGVFNIVASIMILSATQHLHCPLTESILTTESSKPLSVSEGKYALVQIYLQSGMCSPPEFLIRQAGF